MNTAFGFSWSARVVQVMTPTTLRGRPSDCPRRPAHREPHHAATCRGEGMTGSPPGLPPSRNPGPDESTIKHF